MILKKKKKINCYMNASLQYFSNSKELTDYFLKLYKENPYKKNDI